MKRVSGTNIIINIIIVPFFFAIVSALIIEFFKNQTSKYGAFNSKMFVEILNLCVLLFFCFYSLKVKNLYAKENKEKIFSDIFHGLLSDDQSSNISVKTDLERVNILVRQLNYNILFYALCLIIVYFTYIIQNFVNSSDLTMNIYLIYIEELFNFFSSIFIYLSFLVLYDITLDDNNDKNNYYIPSVIFTIVFVIVYFIISVGNDANSNNNHHMLTLLIGILNGLAMGLLFGRIISMEHTFQNIDYINNATVYIHNEVINGKKNLYYIDEQNSKINLTGFQKFRKSLVLYCVIYILPIYVLAQPFFGDFGVSLRIKNFEGPSPNANFDSAFVGVNHVYIEKNTPSIDSSYQVLYKSPNQLIIKNDPVSSKFNDNLMSSVFGICFIGKALFIFVYLVYIKRRWLHMYILMVIRRHGVPYNLISCLKLDD